LDHQAPLKLAQKPPGCRHELKTAKFVPLTQPCEAAKETMNAKHVTRIGSARRSGSRFFYV
jgi:hypothetical protein